MKDTRPEQDVRTKNLTYSHLVRCRMLVGLRIFQHFSSSFFWAIYLEKSFIKNRFNCPNNCWKNNHFSFQNDRRCIFNVFSSKIEFQYIVLTSCWKNLGSTKNTLQKNKKKWKFGQIYEEYTMKRRFTYCSYCKHFSSMYSKKWKEQI